MRRLCKECGGTGLVAVTAVLKKFLSKFPNRSSFRWLVGFAWQRTRRSRHRLDDDVNDEMFWPTEFNKKESSSGRERKRDTRVQSPDGKDELFREGERINSIFHKYSILLLVQMWTSAPPLENSVPSYSVLGRQHTAHGLIIVSNCQFSQADTATQEEEAAAVEEDAGTEQLLNSKYVD